MIVGGSFILMAFERVNLVSSSNRLEMVSYKAPTRLFDSVLPRLFEWNRFEHNVKLSRTE